MNRRSMWSLGSAVSVLTFAVLVVLLATLLWRPELALVAFFNSVWLAALILAVLFAAHVLRALEELRTEVRKLTDADHDSSGPT